jgi:hypothetical protein
MYNAGRRMKLSRKGTRILNTIRRDCLAFGIRIQIRKGFTVRCEGDECSGYFDPISKIIRVASKADEVTFFSVLLHEYAHFIQWRDSTLGRDTHPARVWSDYSDVPHMRSKGPRKTRWRAYKALLALELNAELSSFKQLTKHKLGTPGQRHGQLKYAALYLYCHRLMFDKRRWFKEGSGDLGQWLMIPGVWDALPNTLSRINFTKIPPKLRKLIEPLF